jgi:DNA-binding NtrC family response regulator
MKLIKTMPQPNSKIKESRYTSSIDDNIIADIEILFEQAVRDSLDIDERFGNYQSESLPPPLLTLYIYTNIKDENDAKINKKITSNLDELSAHVAIDSDKKLLSQQNILFLDNKSPRQQWKKPIEHFVENLMQQSINPLLEEFSRFNLCGRSLQFIQVIKTIKKLAHCEAPLLIQGETGTGKENTARAVHYLSTRKDHTFIPVNCGAIAENLIEAELFGYEKGAYTGAEKSQMGLVDIAEKGTLFLDEVDSLSAKAQTVLLRFLQNGEYRSVGGRTLKKADVHIIAATNANLEENISKQLFRQDLYYRLNVLNIHLPPLRERPEDIETIAQSIIAKLCIQHQALNRRLSPNAIIWLQQQPWAGNIRELENTLLREFLLCNSDTIEALAANKNNGKKEAALGFKAAKDAAIRRFEVSYIQKVLKLTNGNVSRAAKIAGKERSAFGKLIKKHHIEKMA